FAPSPGRLCFGEGIVLGQDKLTVGAPFGRPQATIQGRPYGETVHNTSLRGGPQARRGNPYPVQGRRIPTAPPGPRNDEEGAQCTPAGGHAGPPLQNPLSNVERRRGQAPALRCYVT